MTTGMQSRDDLARIYCFGQGVELGPGQRPTGVPRGTDLCFVDKRSSEELRAYFGSSNVIVGEKLEAFERGSFDFLIAHHVLEHCSNVIEELIEWMSFVKDDGVLFLSVPNRAQTPDQSRLLAPPAHFVTDYLMGVDDSSFESREHIYSFLWGWVEDGGLAGKSKLEARSLVSAAVHKPTNDLHWHVFTPATFKFVVEVAARLSGRRAKVRYSGDGTDLPEHRLVVSLSRAANTDADAVRLISLKAELGAFVQGFCLEALAGQPLYTHAAADKDKIFVADGAKARWVREPQTLVERGIADTPPVYVEFGRTRDSVVGDDLASTAFEMTHGRADLVRRRVRWESGAGLEISPGAAPLIEKQGANVVYCDKVSSEVWRNTYLGDKNLTVDVVLADKRIDEVFQSCAFDYVVSSHVLEHIPDFVGFFLSAQRVLKAGGDLVMLVPDKRYTFDVLRAPSTFEQVERAHLLGLTHPSREMALDFYSNADNAATGEALWLGQHTPRPTHSADEAARLAEVADLATLDLHCWVFTPADTRTLLAQVCAAHATELQLLEVSETPTGGNEFLVHLRKAAT